MEELLNNRKHKPIGTYVNAIVTAVQDITPHFRRITLRDEQFKHLENCLPGIHLKVFIPRNGQRKAVLPEIINGRPSWFDETTKPAIRTYTLRGLNVESGELTIDFVLHGDNGPASAWAGRALPGDYLGLGIRPGKGFPEANWYFFGGDETAIPAIVAMLEALPEKANGVALLEVGSAVDIVGVNTRSAVEVRWFSRNGEPAEESDMLLNIICDLPLLSAGYRSRYVWIAGEASVIKPIREYLRGNLTLGREEMSVKAYWKAGTSEDNLRSDEN